MNLSRYKLIGLQIILLNQLFMVDLYNPRDVLASENSNQPSPEYIRNIPDNRFYILGPGDILNIKVKDDLTPELNKNFSINGEGIANLARLKRIYAAGLTIGELTEILNKEYSAYVKEPNVELLVINYRPVKIFIDGEVEEPGMHVLEGSINPINETLNNNITRIPLSQAELTKTSDLDQNIFFPSIIDAIRKSKGVTFYANLKNITVTRINSISNGGGRISTEVNLISTLDLKDSSQNLRLFDGDTISIPKNEEPVLSQLSKAVKSNLNPKFIDVYVGGRVDRVGTITVNKATTLSEAIEISGGAKALRGPVTFMRYKQDGTIDRRRFPLNSKAKRGSFNNPYLKNSDIIYVGKSALNITTEVITDLTKPIQGLFTTYGFYKVITDN